MSFLPRFASEITFKYLFIELRHLSFAYFTNYAFKLWCSYIYDVHKSFTVFSKEKNSATIFRLEEKKNFISLKKKIEIEQLLEIARPLIYSIIQLYKKFSTTYVHIKDLEGISATRPGPRNGRKKILTYIKKYIYKWKKGIGFNPIFSITLSYQSKPSLTLYINQNVHSWFKIKNNANGKIKEVYNILIKSTFSFISLSEYLKRKRKKKN